MLHWSVLALSVVRQLTKIICGDSCRMRWTVRGIPRVPWNAEGVFDGVSTFRLDREGKIYEHQVNIMSSCILFPSIVNLRLVHALRLKLVH